MSGTSSASTLTLCHERLPLQDPLMIQDGCYNSSHCNHIPVCKKEEPILSLQGRCTHTDIPLARPCKEGWKMESLFQAAVYPATSHVSCDSGRKGEHVLEDGD